jgi:hypothetical protein
MCFTFLSGWTINTTALVIIYYDADVFNGGRQLLRLQALRPLGPAQDYSYVAEQHILEQSSSSALAGCPVFRVKQASLS